MGPGISYLKTEIHIPEDRLCAKNTVRLDLFIAFSCLSCRQHFFWLCLCQKPVVPVLIL